eukprot:3141687-Ditylum_brightwellii.AAC.1
MDLFDAYLKDKAENGYCEKRVGGGKRPTAHDCLSFLKDDRCCSVVATYCYEFGCKSYSEQRQTVVDWTRYANASNKSKLVFLVPFIPPRNLDDPACVVSTLMDIRLCPNALLTMLGRGEHFWKGIKDVVKICSSRTVMHGNKGKGLNRKQKSDDPMVLDLHKHFQDLHQYSEVIATRYVLEATGKVTEHDNDDDV